MVIRKSSFFSLINTIVFSIAIFEIFFFSYEKFIYYHFAYYGYNLNYPSLGRHVITLSIYLLLTVLPSKKFEKPSDFFLVYILFIILLPASVMVAYNAISYLLYGIYIFSYITLLLITNFGSNIPKLKLVPFEFKKKYVALSLISLSLITVSIFFKYKGGNLNFSFVDIYAYRDESRETFSGVLAYIIKWLSYSIFPFILVWGLYSRKNLIIFFAVLGQFLIYGFTNHKSYFFNIILIFAIYFIFNYLADKPKINKFNFILIIFFVFSLFLMLMSFGDYGLIGSLFFRRLFFWPVLISDSYVNFALEYGFSFYNNIEPVSNIISSYMQREGEYTNTGYIANAYLQGGLLLLMVYNILLSMMLIIYNKALQDRLPKQALICLCIVTFRPLLGSDLLVGILSNGVAFMMLLQLIIFNSKYFFHSNEIKR